MSHTYQIELEQKKVLFVKAKNKTEARKKAKAKLERGNSYFKIEDIIENDYGFFY